MDERYDEKRNLIGDYYKSNVILEPEEKIILNKCGLLRLNYLKEHKKADYMIMFMNKTLNKNLKEVQENAKEQV